jgi:hypothetical protein
LGYGRGFPMLSFCLRKKKSSTYFHAHVRWIFSQTDIIAKVWVHHFFYQANFFAQVRPNHFHK